MLVTEAICERTLILFNGSIMSCYTGKITYYYFKCYPIVDCHCGGVNWMSHII